MELLRGAGYRRLLDVPAVPCGNASRLRYDVVLPVLPGPTEWYLRSFGVGFDLVHPSWRRQGDRWYSLGWGVVGAGQTQELLLLQAWAESSCEEFRTLRDLAEEYVEHVDVAGCVRVAAVISRED